MTKAEAQKHMNKHTYVWVYLHGKFYGTRLEGIYHLAIMWKNEVRVAFFTVWNELVVNFSDYGDKWEVITEEEALEC